MLIAKKVSVLVAAALLGVSLSACAGNGPKSADAKVDDKVAAKSTGLAEMYEAHKDGRIWVFGNADLYRGFLGGKEVALQVTRIGAGPNGETVKFGITKDESKMIETLPQIAAIDGKLDGVAQGFYGETFKDGRFYVFDDWNDMKAFRKSGDAPLAFTYIGKGPNRATVVYVRNKSTAKVKPVAAMERFNKQHGL
ncbi:MAG: hypothetical protein PHS60_18085 [Zavarzinia sp.]|jgi:hypothetical protein|nr:hypothetical protein [Zavarzinia sp.]MDX9766261.1 hypothetical protein [Ectothiorhodospiraceae bacterium]